ncbi:alkaline phosphatase D family protein [Botrimarina hoheduenensis]|uniref:PhoD-like phosphatase n=1 Tax=Botrimarina hoheduenensis TaxID=2528000 RepID=A0A5C5WAR0_9BACT|nr:alkaline phosphatase D family protein [Botrimarina hoheduenensis]TWT47770.1 PhoD-like phosphatase [Botrimarina hoheduenensis]
MTFLTRGSLKGLLALAVVLTTVCRPATGETPLSPERIDKIAFGSCAKQDLDQPIWDDIVAQQPDAFLFIGDNMYADRKHPPRSAGDIAAAYRKLGAKPGFRRLRRACPVLATWDDHDYGLNDAGGEFPFKEASQTVMLSFFREPADSPRWGREGVYGAWRFGPEDQRVQVLLLDTRYFRSPLREVPAEKRQGRGPYGPQPDGGGSLLGEAQWQWLEEQLSEPAAVRLIGSSVQVVSDEHGWEGWSNFPRERQRLYDLIDSTKARGVIFLSGDRHLAEISRSTEAGTPYPMWDFTSSGLTDPKQPAREPNRNRVGPLLKQTQFGMVRIDWSAGPQLTLEAIGLGGESLLSQQINLADLRVTPAPAVVQTN